MNPLLVISIPLVLLIVGMILNNFGLSFDQPASSSEQDPAKRLEAERHANRDFFYLQKTQSLKRQSRVGQYAWLLLVAFIASHLWMYFDTVNKTTAFNKIAAIQTMPTEKGKEMVLSVTLNDGSNAKYLIKMTKADPSDAAAKEGISKDTVSSWEMSGLETALSIGDNPLPLGIALTISN